MTGDQLRGVRPRWWALVVATVLSLGFRYWGAFIWTVLLRKLGAHDVRLDAELDEDTRLLADVRGRARPPFDLGLTLRAEADAVQRYAPTVRGRLALVARARLRGDADRPQVVADLTCSHCVLDGVGPVRIDGVAAVDGADVRGRIALGAADVAVVVGSLLLALVAMRWWSRRDHGASRRVTLSVEDNAVAATAPLPNR